MRIRVRIMPSKFVRTVGLPDLDQRILQRHAYAIMRRPGDDDLSALHWSGFHPRLQILGINYANPAEIRRAANIHIRPGRLAGAFFQLRQRLHHDQSPSGRVSNSVCLRPRRVMSKLLARASIGTVRCISIGAISDLTASGFWIVPTMGQIGNSGSPSK
jgi:hypothetical protein